MPFEAVIKNAILQITSEPYDVLHAMRVISNIYADYHGKVTEDDIRSIFTLASNYEMCGDYKNVLLLLAYLLSGRKREYEPFTFDKFILYSGDNWRPWMSRLPGMKIPKVDNDLLRFNVVCAEKEFE